MKKQKTLEKTLILGIIILLITAIIPSINAGNTITKEMNQIYNDNNINPLNTAPVPKLSGTPGENFWYISDVSLTFLYSPTEVKAIWYNNGDWIQYTDTPIIVSKEGKTNIPWKYIDREDIEHNGTSIFLKIDKTPPTIKLTKTSGANNQVIFTATCEDKISEIDYVEFYLDDEYQATDNTTPYKWTWTGTDQHSVHATAYNLAGLKQDSDKVNTPRTIIINFLQFINEILQKIIYRIWH